MGSSRFVDVHKWVGQSAAPLDPLAMQFRARVADEGSRDCAGCIFKGQHWRVCLVATAAAVKSSMPDCDDRDPATKRTHVYVLVPQDARQISLIDLP
jgi:hypothetical protein